MSKSRENLVFVYGTLKSGHHNHYLLGNSVFMGNCATMSKHKMVSLGGFPGVIYRGGMSQITGEVYAVDRKEVRDALDQLEGYPDFYDKARIVTPWGVAVMYILSKPFLAGNAMNNEPAIETGVWE